MKFRGKSHTPSMKQVLLTKEQQDAVLRTEKLLQLFKKVCLYTYGARKCEGMNINTFFTERWCRSKDAERQPEQLSQDARILLQRVYGKEHLRYLVNLGVSCVLYKKDPILFLPDDYRDRPFKIEVNENPYLINQEGVTDIRGEKIRRCKHGALCLTGLKLENQLNSTRNVGAFSTT